MSVPKPRSGESQDEFMGRCISFLVNEGTPQEQAVAICSTQWENKDMKTLIDYSQFKTKKELFKFLIANKEILIAQKKAIMKTESDIVLPFSKIITTDKSEVIKANQPIENSESLDSIKVKATINTTNFLDSHMDVHIPGLWNKSLQENKMIMFLQEHQLKFDKIIADGDDLKVKTEMMTWAELGFEYPGSTQALVFEAIVRRKRNGFMFSQYANGYVKNHSVGMRYIKIGMAINDEDYVAENELWKEYHPVIVNPEMADEKGFFWVVKEAKAIEGSAVPIGSNTATPTQDNNMKTEPAKATQKQEPTKVTPGINWDYLYERI